MKNKKLTRHHIIPKSRQDEFKFNLYTTNNIIKLTAKTHDALHRLFGNMTPKEQLDFLYNINKKVLSRTSQELLLLLINMDDNDFYSL